MRIHVKARSFFEARQGTPREAALSAKYRIISINASRGNDSAPPFSEHNRRHEHLLCLTFDDVCDEPEPENPDSYVRFSPRHAEAIMRFAGAGDMPMLIHCTAGISRSGAVGEILDWYFNRYIADNQADHQYFVQNNRQIIANSLVRKIFLDCLDPGNGGCGK